MNLQPSLHRKSGLCGPPFAAVLMNFKDCLVSERFSGLERKGDALLGFAFSAERQERLALKVEEILLADDGAGGNGASAQDVGNVVGDFLVVVADVVGLAHQVDAEFQRRQRAFAGSRDFARSWAPNSLRRLA